MSAGLLLAAAALLCWPPRPRARARVLPRSPGRPHRTDRGPSRRRALVLGAAAGLAVALVVGGAGGAVLGALAGAVACRALLRAGAPPPADVDGDLPVACDLLAVCLAAGAPVAVALAAVGEAVPGPVGRALAEVAARTRLGSPARAAWAGVPPPLAGLARVLVRAGESGSGAVPALQSLAADTRAAARERTRAAVARAGVRVLAPLGACFLPAFVCLGVAPLVVGLARDVLG